MVKNIVCYAESVGHIEGDFNSKVDLKVSPQGASFPLATIKGGVPMSISPSIGAGPVSLTVGPFASSLVQDHYELQTQRLNVAMENGFDFNERSGSGLFIPNSKTANYDSDQTVLGQSPVNQSNGDKTSSNVANSSRSRPLEYRMFS